MTIKNQKTVYTVEAQDGAMKLTGNISVRDNNVIEANLNVASGDGAERKVVSYRYLADRELNESYSGSKELAEAAKGFISAEIAAFKTQILN